MLVNPKLCETYCDYAKSLLVTCVENIKLLYGKGMTVYNVHELVHLADDARVFGALHNFSSFPFENKLKSIKTCQKTVICTTANSTTVTGET